MAANDTTSMTSTSLQMTVMFNYALFIKQRNLSVMENTVS